MTPQGERVPVSRRLQSDAPDTGQRFEFIGQCNRCACRCRRQGISRESGLVVFRTGHGHFFGFAVVAGVVRSHNALQFREFTDHFRQQVGFDQSCRAVDKLCIDAHFFRNENRQEADTGHSLGKSAQLVVVHDIGEARQPVFEPFLFVLFEEETGIRQTWTDHAFVTADDTLRGIGFHIGYDQKARAQTSFGIG